MPSPQDTILLKELRAAHEEDLLAAHEASQDLIKVFSGQDQHDPWDSVAAVIRTTINEDYNPMHIRVRTIAAIIILAQLAAKAERELSELKSTTIKTE